MATQDVELGQYQTQSAASFLEISTRAHERFSALPAYNTAMQIVPLDDSGGKRPAKAFMPNIHLVPKTSDGLALFAAVYPTANAGIRSRREAGALFIIDCDEPGVTQRIERETGRTLPSTYTTLTSPDTAPWKQHLVFMSTAHSVDAVKKQVTDVTHICGYDLKGCGGGFGYVAVEGSVRNGETIIAIRDVPIAPVPDWLVDYLVADIAKARERKRATTRAQKAAASETEAAPPTPPRPFAVSRDDRNFVLASRIRTWKNTGVCDDDVFDLLVKHIRLHFEDGEQLLASKDYVAKLRAMIAKVPTLGATSYVNLTHHRRRRRRSRITLSELRDKFKSSPDEITPADARIIFSVQDAADHTRLMRELRAHGYVALGRQGSHARTWHRLPALASISRKEPSSLYIVQRRLSPPQHKELTVRKSVRASGGDSERCGRRPPVFLTVTQNGERPEETAAAAHEGEAAARRLPLANFRARRTCTPSHAERRMRRWRDGQRGRRRDRRPGGF